MSTSLAIYLTGLAICVLILVRNGIVFRARTRRLQEISSACKRDLRRDNFFELMDARYAELDSPSYDAMLFDVRRWTYRHLYPKDVA